MKFAVEKKDRGRLYFLGGLLVLAGIYYVWPDSTSAPTAPVSKARPSTAAPEVAPDTAPSTRRRAVGRVAAGDFRPKLRDNSPEKRQDLTKIDPTIKLMLLARVQNVAMEGGARNIFQFGPAIPIAPATPLPKVKPIVPTPPVEVAQKPVNPGPPPEPSAPPIPFKYYGYSNMRGETRKRVFFLDGEDVIVAWEGDMIKNRYKVVHVGLRSVDMEDTQFKNGKQQLPLAEEVAG